MKKILYLFSFFIFSYAQIVNAQSDSFTYRMNIWTVSSQFHENASVPPILTCDYQFMGDTSVGGKNYQKLVYKSSPCQDNFFFAGSALIRNEGGNKIYVLIPNCTQASSCPAKSEVLLYDFSLKKGDSLVNYLRSKIVYSKDTSIRKIVSKITNVDTILIFGKFRKRWAINYLDSNRITGVDYWIDGIGSTRHPLSPLITETVVYFETNLWLSCFKGMTGSNCLSAVEDNFLVADLTLYPNPANDVLRITFDKNFDIVKKISITDVSGRTLKNITVQTDALTMDVKDLPSGFYLLQVQTANGTGFKKFLVNR